MGYDQFIQNVLTKAIKQPSGNYCVHPNDLRQNLLIDKMIDNDMIVSVDPLRFNLTEKGKGMLMKFRGLTSDSVKLKSVK